MPKVGKNIVYQVKDDKLTITIDLKKEIGMSKSGKNMNVATTQGNKELEGVDDMFMGINVYKNAE